MHQIRLRLGLRQRQAASAPPDPIARFTGPTSKGREGGQGRGTGRGKGEREGRDRRGENGKGEKRKEGGEKEGLPPLEWRSGYAHARPLIELRYI